ncbi:MAG: hypothetical protein L0Y67_04275 [Gammaproteobacteria bacterium]|nr:hypothetical protein [Gammaproteobacteria bacterium]
MLRSITLFLAVAGFVGLVAVGSMSLDRLKSTHVEASRSVYAPTLLASETASTLTSRVGLPRALLQTVDIWAGLYLTSLVLCRTLVASGRSAIVLLALVLLVIILILLSRAIDMFVVIAYLPALLVLLALWLRGITDPVT